MLPVDVDLYEDGLAGVFLGKGFVGGCDLTAGAAVLCIGKGGFGGWLVEGVEGQKAMRLW